ncbi:thiamine-phosphate kinase [Ornithinibacillus scapharcae]|uniref:thiamine-phosphate kinase n=1 Tax=Ornithinibacillus scapharcae TaxID=1147159 RepID=UPI000225BC0B|nr:thiamine-phosphate kinase [Ornithinibacillus scapharcae]
MDEFSFIESIQQHYYRQSTLAKGVGDDAAVFSPMGNDVVTAKDMFVENIHFAKHTMTPFQIGYKALAANISDMAAMGAKPVFYLVGITISKDWLMEDILKIYTGMKSLADQFKMDLIGGDTVAGKELVVSVTIIGYVDKEKARYRNLAREGDVVFATGTLGDSQAGLHILNNPGEYLAQEFFIRRHQLPTPRVEFSCALESISRLSLNDISDGIASEANEIAQASGVSIEIYEDKLPIHPAFKQFPFEYQFKWKLFGGEDYEILGTVPKKHWMTVKEIADKMNMLVTDIGLVTPPKASGHVLLKRINGKIEQLEKKGYNHLSR